MRASADPRPPAARVTLVTFPSRSFSDFPKVLHSLPIVCPVCPLRVLLQGVCQPNVELGQPTTTSIVPHTNKEELHPESG